ncbi:ATP-binding protein [Clostridium magnum]|uniref:Anti-sigma F factor n=1 Tax=Clostridium magnum DSM 2767 TaxID=1121326 RepID=A0A161WKS4_9CLOT|nr:ATP-binding protein [Clostridium magnum]KZL92335.1 anti-sigma F factor [Clostridium magnum DSM 2767]SHH12999.1 Histidine kinase-like ATPase domain-containing protein [Clostridium magnum DSM 2767]
MINVPNNNINIELLEYQANIKGIFDIKSIGSIIKTCHKEAISKYRNKSISNKFATCLYELIANAVEHGNENSNNKYVHINIAFLSNKITLRVEDEGQGFSWENYNYNFEESYEYRGRGLKIVKYYCDDLKFNHKGNIAYACIFI